jgi:hypothetical protein
MALTDTQVQDLVEKIFDESTQLSANEIQVIFANKSQFKGLNNETFADLALATAAQLIPGASAVASAATAYFAANITTTAYEAFIGKFADQTIKLIKSGGLNQAYLEDLISPNKNELFVDGFDFAFWTFDKNFFDEMVAALIENPNNLDNIPYLETPSKFDVEGSKELRRLLDGPGVTANLIPYVASYQTSDVQLIDPVGVFNYSGTIPEGVFNSVASGNEDVANLRRQTIEFKSSISGLDLSTSNLKTIDETLFIKLYGRYLAEAIKTGTNPEAVFNKYIADAARDLGAKFAAQFETTRRVELWSGLVDANSLGSAGITPEELAQALDGANAAALESAEATGQVGAIDDSDGLSEADIQKRQRFFQQCCLMVLMNDLQPAFREEILSEVDGDNPTWHNSGSVFNDRFYMVNDQDNTRFVNTLIAPKGDQIRDFLNITPDIQAFLVPKIRLYKVYGNNENLRQVEFVFRNNTVPDSALNTLFNENDVILRGAGYGIKEFSFNYEGTSPATAKNDIKVNLKLYFQDFKDFVTKFKTVDSEGNEEIISFVELLFFDQKDADRTPQTRQQYDPSYYRVRADVGWQVPDSSDQTFIAVCNKRGLSAERIKNAIVKMNKSFYLTMIDHTLDFAKDGTVSIDADYIAYIEAELKNSRFDALSNKEITDARRKREEQLVVAERICTPGEIAALKRNYNAQEKQDIKKAHKRIMNELYANNKIFNLHLTSDGGFRENGFFKEMPTFQNATGGSATPATTAQAASNQPVSTAGTTIPKTFLADDPENNVQYFYLGDLIYVVLDSLFEQNIDPVKFILPSIDIEGYLTNAGSFSINIAKIPISVLYFKEWFTNTIIKPERKSYAIMYFIRDLLNNLVVDALIETCLNRNYDKSFRFDTTSVTSNGDKLQGLATPGAEVINLVDNNNLFPLTTESDTGAPVDISNMVNYIVIMPSYGTINNNGRGIYDEDIDKGVYHFEIGVDRGILNDVKFSKVDMAYVREARMEQQSGVDGLLQLAAVYKASVNTFGNTLFYPGMMVFINPFGLGGDEFIPTDPNSVANKLGLGGYHLITRVNSVITNGSFRTSLEAMFEYPGDGQTRTVTQGEAQSQEVTDAEFLEETGMTRQQAVEACDNILTRETDTLRAQLRGQNNRLEDAPPRTETIPFVGPSIPQPTPDPNGSSTNSSVVVTTSGPVNYNSTQNEDDIFVLYLDSSGTEVARQELDENGNPTGDVSAS